MRRVVTASICAAVLWFGVMEFGGGLLHQEENALDRHQSGYSETVSLEYETRPLLSGSGEGADAASEDGLHPEKAVYRPDYDGAIDSSKETPTVQQGTGENANTDEKAEPETGAAGVVGKGAKSAKQEDASSETKSEPNAKPETKAASEPKSGKVLYLTFDDGPSRYTPEVLDILKREGVKATFFVLGEHVEQYPEIAKRIVEEGHAIGNHTYNHVYEKLYGSFGDFASQIMRTDDAIYEAAGVRTTLVRAPGGTYANFDKGYFDALEAAGYRVHDWNVDSGDSKRRGVPAAEIMSNIKESRIADTLNVLLHDGVGHEESVKALPQIIRYYKELGYSFEVLSDEVKPMQFQLADRPKWSRGAVRDKDREMLVSFGKQLDASGERNLSPYREPALIIHRGEETLVLESDQYELIRGVIHVPLLTLTEWMGGEAELDEESGVIEAFMLGKRVFWMTDTWPPKEEDESLMMDVPLRATLSEFGLDITDYVITSERREVWIEE
ncbi:polysaccharide deacetylase family protein [Paenibacillus nanensis]|nr:polysaccharide deacetylase family protein [Paenibacillus nanensis]